MIKSFIKAALALALILAPAFASAAHFKVGYAERDITPTASVPMWGYGGMGARLSTGTFDPLHACVVVIDTGDGKLALMGLDMGRGPRASSMVRIRKEVLEKAGVNFVLISGSHTHHGPVTELTDNPGKGQGKYDDAVKYAIELEDKIIAAIVEASEKVVDAKMGLATTQTNIGRNRHTKFQPRHVDGELAVMRFDDLAGKPIAVVVNVGAHSTIINAALRKFSAEWPGQMKKNINEIMNTKSVFMQGSAGDLSPNTNDVTDKIRTSLMERDKAAGLPMIGSDAKPQDIYTIEAFGKQVADQVVALAKDLATAVPEKPSIQGKVNAYEFPMRIQISDNKIRQKFSFAFFAELANCFGDELAGDLIRPEMSTIVLNGDLALVGGSGEYFSNHSIHLKARARTKTLFIGYCNGHHMYVPTIEAQAEGGYGGDDMVSWIPFGSGEEMMDDALINIYEMTTGFPTVINKPLEFR